MITVRIYLILFFLGTSFLCAAQNTNTSPFKYKYFSYGFEFIHPNYTGNIEDVSTEISSSNRSSLMNYSSNFSYSIYVSTQKQFSKTKNLYLKTLIGLNSLQGAFDIREHAGSIVGISDVFEKRRSFDFNAFYLFSSVGISYDIKKIGLEFSVAPKIGIRILSKGSGAYDKFLMDYSVNPINAEFIESKEIDFGYDWSGALLASEFGLGKRIEFKKSALLFGFKFEYQFLALHGPSDFKPYPLKLFAEYAFKFPDN